MASFFTKYPKLIYNNTIVTDILSRVALREKYSSAVELYYEYETQDGDTPEIIAAKYYGDPEKDWIILLMNEIIDPYYDIRLSYQQFVLYMNSKYKTQGDALHMTGFDYAASHTNPAPFSYMVDITTIDSETGTIAVNSMYIDEISYNGTNTNNSFNFNSTNNISYNKRRVTILEYENQLNEAKGKIKLLQKQYVSQFEKELESLLKLKYS